MNTDEIKNNNQVMSAPIENQNEQEMIKNKVQSATEEYKKSWIDKALCCLNWMQKYFEITSVDFYRRYLYSLIPFTHKFSQAVNGRPDFYGPFWIYTTLIICISSAGCLTKFFKGDPNSKNTNFFEKFIPIAGVIIYGAGFGLPILLGLLIKVFGSRISIPSVLCTYGYSLSAFIPSVILCVIPIKIVQLILLFYATLSSTIMLIVNYWKDLGNFSTVKKIIIAVIVLIVQIGIFMIFSFYFLAQFSKNAENKSSKKEKK